MHTTYPAPQLYNPTTKLVTANPKRPRGLGLASLLEGGNDTLEAVDDLLSGCSYSEDHSV